MSKNIVKILKKPLGLVGISAILIPSLASCGAYSDIKYQDKVIRPENPTLDPSSSVALARTRLSSNVLSALELAPNQKINIKSSNKFGFEQNASEFLQNIDLKSYAQVINDPFFELGLKKDILNYVYSLWLDNKDVLINASDFVNWKFTKNPLFEESTNSDSNVDTTYFGTLSFNLPLKIKATKDLNFNFLDSNIPLKADQVLDIVLGLNESKLRFELSSVSTRKFLTWKIDHFELSNGVVSLGKDNFVFNANNYSYAFLTEFNNLTDKQNYFELYKAKKDLFINSITNQSLEGQIEVTIKNEFNKNYLIISSLSRILGEINKDVPIDLLLKNQARNITNLLVNFGFIEKDYKDLVIDLLSSVSQKTDIQDGLLGVLIKNKTFIQNKLNSDLGAEVSTAIKTIIDSLNSKEDALKNKEALTTLVDQLPKNLEFLKELINLFVSGKSTYDVLDLLINQNYEKVVQLFGSNPIVKPGLDLLRLLITKNENNKFNSILDLLTGSKKDILINTLFGIIKTISPNSIATLTTGLDLLVNNNPNFNKTNVQTLINDWLKFFNYFFETKDGKDLDNLSTEENTPLNDIVLNRLKNLDYENKWVKKAEFEKATQKVSYSYKLVLIPKTPFELNLTSLKNLLPDEIKVGTNNQTVAKKYINDILPNHISLNTSVRRSRINFTYSADKQTIFFDPVADKNRFLLGYTIPTNLNLFYDDFAAAVSISKQYNLIFGFDWTNFATGFVRSLAKDVMLRDYDFSINLKLVDKSIEVATTDNYNPNLYTTNVDFSYNINDANYAELSKQLFDYYKIEDTNNYTYNIRSNLWTDQKLIFKNTANLFTNQLSYDTEETLGIKPKFSHEQAVFFIRHIYKLNDNFNSAFKNNPELIVNFSAIPSLNLKFDVKLLWINFKAIRISLVNTSAYTPYKVLDLTNKALTNNFSYSLFYVST